MKPSSPAAARNREPILQALAPVLRRHRAKRVLEIGSGTGQHAQYFGDNLPEITWQTSDLSDNFHVISQWVEETLHGNVLAPLILDTLTFPDAALIGVFDAVYTANTSHIMHWPAVQGMFAGVCGCLSSEGVFVMYGPFNVDGAFTSESNQQFDASLRARDEGMGLRDLRELRGLGRAHGLTLSTVHQMPANNMLLEWEHAVK